MLRRIRRPEAPESLLWNWSPIPVGEPNIAYAAYFSGRSYLTPLARSPVESEGGTFEPFCSNDWHIHRAESGGWHILIVAEGTGLCQELGCPARQLVTGETVFIYPNVKHWLGGAPDECFRHIAIEVPGTNTSTQGLERGRDADYLKTTQKPRAIPTNL